MTTVQKVLILGAGVGIGRGIALAFAGQGADLMVSDLSEAQAAATAQLVIDGGGKAEAAVCDVSDRQAVVRTVAAAAERLGGLDVVIQNAGIFPYSPLIEAAPEAIERTVSVNLLSAFWVAQAAAPLMRDRGGGRLIFTSSVCGNRGTTPGLTHYAATKAGLNGFIRNAAVELGPLGVTVNGVEPGLIEVERHAGWGDALPKAVARIPLRRSGGPADIAGAMLYLASPAAAYVTGQTIVVDGGFSLVGT